MVLAVTLSASAALAQTAPLSYAVPDSGAWSDILKNDRKASTGRAKATAERKKSAPAQRQAKARPAKTNSKAEAREAFASAPPKRQVNAADVRIVSPDEFNEIDQMAGAPQ
jgi:hypothetical protein